MCVGDVLSWSHRPECVLGYCHGHIDMSVCWGRVVMVTPTWVSVCVGDVLLSWSHRPGCLCVLETCCCHGHTDLSVCWGIVMVTPT